MQKMSHWTLLLMLFGLLILSPLSTHAQVEDYGTLLTGLVDNIIVPDLATYQAALPPLYEAVVQLKEAPTPEHLEAAQSAWYAAATAWQAPSILPLRPIMNLHRRMFKTPIRDLIIEHYIEGKPLIDEPFIQSIGSNAVGLSTLEYLLFPLDGDNTALLTGFTGLRADYAVSAVAALINNADQLALLWQEHRADYINGAWFDGDPRESVSMTLNEILGSVEVMAKDHLGKPLGVRVADMAQPDAVYAIRSGADIRLIGAKLAGLEPYFNMEYGFGAYLTSIGSEGLAQDIVAEFAAARLAWSALEGKTLSEWVITDRVPVEALYEHLRNLVRLIKVDMANVTGITITFNDADGD